MFLPGRILNFGGNSNKSIVIDIRGSSPTTKASGSMSSRRQWVTGTILADGRVLATGGSTADNELTGVNNAAGIWDPATGKWTLGKSGSRPRLYHSGGLLLPDGSVLVHGGGAPGPVANLHSEIYYPPYLYNSSDEFRTQPRILDAPSVLQLDSTFSVVTDSTTISRVTLVRMGSVTHSVNMDQRFLELSFTQSSTTLFVEAPDSINDAPPGYYLLFVINDRKTPSVASIVRINVPGGTTEPPPSGDPDESATYGGTGGEPFTLSCNSGEAVVGAYGDYSSTYVRSIGVRCVAVDTNGRWVGNPVNRGQTGGSSGSSYTRTCARDQAVAGFRGRFSDGVNLLRLECRPLDSSGQLTGDGKFLAAIGSDGNGSSRPPTRCPSNTPAFAFGGRSSDRIDAFKVKCQKLP
jgi:hypothetical protein